MNRTLSYIEFSQVLTLENPVRISQKPKYINFRVLEPHAPTFKFRKLENCDFEILIAKVKKSVEWYGVGFEIQFRRPAI